jgi:hypothetical protein
MPLGSYHKLRITNLSDWQALVTCEGAGRMAGPLVGVGVFFAGIETQPVGARAPARN